MTHLQPPDWTEFEDLWAFDAGVVRIVQKPGSPSRDELWHRVDRNEMTQPYIVETATERRLHFTRHATQSIMLLSDPDALATGYTREMMSFLLFTPAPRRILMIGLGGGSLAKFCYRQLPDADLTVVEINEDVIALRDEFFIPRDDQRFRIVHADGACYMERMNHDVDVILIDAFDPLGIAESLSSRSFYERAASRLTTTGSLIMNLWGQRTRYAANLKHAGRAFKKNIRLVPVSSGENVLLFALKRPVPDSIGADLESLAQHLQTRLKLEFPRYLRRFCQGHTLVVAQASAPCGLRD